MKASLLLFILSTLLYSCQKEEPIKPEVPTWDDLHLTWSRTMLPDAYYTNITKAVFVNDLGEERKLNLRIDTTVQLVIKDTIHYKMESFTILFSDSLVSEFYMQVSATLQYSPSGLKHFENFFTVLLAPKEDSFNPIIALQGPDQIQYGTFLSSKTIAGLNFENVYAFIPEIAGDHSYDELYYGVGLGIVGFQGKNGEMWGLKGYE